MAATGSTRWPASSTTTSPVAGTASTSGSTCGSRAASGSAVLRHLSEIPYGSTESYAEVAVASGSPKAVRAVGSACATNPLPIVVPCHRVVRSDGSLGGYLGGLPTKERLLALEHAPPDV